MKFGAAQIGNDEGREAQSCVVSGITPLAKVFGIVDPKVPFILVENQAGQLIGIVETESILNRLAASNQMERERWSQMPIEAALQWKISSCSATRSAETNIHTCLPVECTAVSTDDGVIALVSDEDIFLSWQSVRESLIEATVDCVTSLPNRLVFERRMREEIARASRKNHSLAVILFDVDHFKEVNDMFGHSVGDATLEAIAGLLQRQLRSYDLLTRYGGDEFAAICGSCRPGEIDIPLLRIQQALKTDFARKAVALPPITLSIGAAVVHDVTADQSIDELVELADMCLYQAKENGRNCAFKIELAEGLSGEPSLVTDSFTPATLG